MSVDLPKGTALASDYDWANNFWENYKDDFEDTSEITISGVTVKCRAFHETLDYNDRDEWRTKGAKMTVCYIKE